MGYWNWYPKPKRRRPADGIRAKTARGEFGATWWAGRWIAALKRLMDPARLSRGRSYARSGQVLNIDIRPGRVDARVQGSRMTPYTVSIRIKPLSPHAWNGVVKAMASQAAFAAKLLSGEMPQDIEKAFRKAGASLFPAARGDLDTECSCPDWANPCKHIAAVYFLLGERFDEDPFLLFRLRGRTREQILAALRAARAAGGSTRRAGKPSARKPRAAAEKPEPLTAEAFWEAAAEPDGLHFHAQAPEVDAAPVKRLGEPPFRIGPGGLAAWMERVYRSVTEEALRAAGGGEERSGGRAAGG
ncbi:MAG: SWIM zinc finger family protein [Anaerolineales bacterium]|nr:SWIM zinc finger family protein [Anaerolineales bacterium]